MLVFLIMLAVMFDSQWISSPEKEVNKVMTCYDTEQAKHSIHLIITYKAF